MKKKVILRGSKEVVIPNLHQTKDTDYKRLVVFLKMSNTQYRAHDTYHNEEYRRRIILQEGDYKVGGYNCFYTEFVFDSDGNMLGCGAYE